jgi:autoinducer 2 (AI-2) kinase
MTGIPEGIPVVIGGADTQCSLLGMSVMAGEAGAVGGTTTPVQLVVDEPVLDPEMRTWSNNYLVDRCWILESNVGYTGRGVRWIRDVLSIGQLSYADLNILAEKVSIGAQGVLSYLGPHLFDNGPPYWPKDQLGNLPVEPTITGSHNFDLGCLTRAVFEANSYGVKANLDQLQDISGVQLDCIHFSGGNSKSDLWMQIQADVLGMHVIVPEVRDATAVGSAVLTSLGTGYYSDLDVALENMVRMGRVFEPRKAESELYQGHYRRWMSTRERLFRQ